MAKYKKEIIEGKLLKLGLKKALFPVFLNLINEKFHDDAIKAFKKLNVVRETSDSESEDNVLMKINDKNFDVHLEIIDDEFHHFCSCAHRESAKGCAHAGAVLLYKMMKDEKNDFNSKSKDLLKESDQKNEGGLGYFRDLFPLKRNMGTKSMIYFDFEDFDCDSQLLRVQRGVIKKDGSYGMPVRLTGKDFNMDKWEISKNVKKALTFLINEESYGLNRATTSGISKKRFYDVNTDLMMPVFRNLFFEEQEIILGATFSKENFRAVWNITKTKDNMYSVKPSFVAGKKKMNLVNMELLELGANSLWVFDCDLRCFYGHKGNADLDIVRSIIRFPKNLILNESELREFFTKYYQDVLDSFELSVSDDLRRESKTIVPKAKLYLEKSGSSVKVNLKFDYLGREVDYFSTNKEVIVVLKDIIYDISRDFEEEDHIAEFLNAQKVVTHEEYDEFVLEEDLVDFIVNTIPKISEEGIEVLGEDKLFNFKVVKSKPAMSLNISEGTDWFDIKGGIKFGKEGVELERVLDAIFQNKRFVELSDGKKAVIPKDWANSLKSYRGFVDLNEKGAKLSKYHVSILESLIKLSKKSDMTKGAQKTVSNFRKFEKIEPSVLSKNVKATLRPYQKAGVDWLCFLNDYNFNGILADDMGLGKTLQTLCLLQKIRDEKPGKTFLVVVPNSLVFNWKNEIKKFTPKMKAYSHQGTNRAKTHKKFEELTAKNDIIITTYGVLRNDLELLTSFEFEYIVLDEAHMIKNPMSIAARSAYALKSKNKIVISGTPIQNNLTELWSLFHFMNPGYLGSYDFFRENFVVPIEKDHNKDISDSLKKIIDPFLMRRNKDVISDELPKKTEVVLRSNFSEGEKETYDNWKDYYLHEIKTSIKNKGFGKSKIKIFEGLMKLRQLCLHPKMIDSKYRGSSGKFDLLMMEIEKVLNEGHKVLVFSSFVKMLSIIKNELLDRGIKYSYLDGSSKNRESIVAEFQESKEARPFLISIKAGGLGLNLTSADYVFIVDPWWNPAVEMQAMDRAHRIGQENPVFVYKMIANNTVEEKILEMQKSKKKLVDELITEEESLMKKIDAKAIKEIFG